MINLRKYVKCIIYNNKLKKLKNKKIKIINNYDKSFWGIVYNTDLEDEEVDNNVRYSFTIYEPIN